MKLKLKLPDSIWQKIGEYLNNTNISNCYKIGLFSVTKTFNQIAIYHISTFNISESYHIHNNSMKGYISEPYDQGIPPKHIIDDIINKFKEINGTLFDVVHSYKPFKSPWNFSGYDSIFSGNSLDELMSIWQI